MGEEEEEEDGFLMPLMKLFPPRLGGAHGCTANCPLLALQLFSPLRASFKAEKPLFTP